MLLRNLILAVTPKSTAAQIEEESKAWIMRCSEGHEQSVWDAGGIRYKAAGSPTRMAWCPKCGKMRLHVVYYRGDPSSDSIASVVRGDTGRSVMRIICTVFSIIGPIFLLCGLLIGAPWWYFSPGLVQTTGQVERIEHNGRGASPVVTFEAGGKRYETEGWISTSPNAYDIGEKVPVLFNPSDPSNARIDSFVERWLMLSIFGSIGLSLSLFGIGGLTLIRLRAPRRKID